MATRLSPVLEAQFMPEFKQTQTPKVSPVPINTVTENVSQQPSVAIPKRPIPISTGTFTGTGAGIGTAIAPGIGTAVGAGAGLVLDGALMFVNKHLADKAEAKRMKALKRLQDKEDRRQMASDRALVNQAAFGREQTLFQRGRVERSDRISKFNLLRKLMLEELQLNRNTRQQFASRRFV